MMFTLDGDAIHIIFTGSITEGVTTPETIGKDALNRRARRPAEEIEEEKEGWESDKARQLELALVNIGRVP